MDQAARCPGCASSARFAVATALAGSSSADSRIAALAAFLVLGPLLAWIPIAALAGVLIVVGGRMFDKHSLTLVKSRSTMLDFVVIVSVVAVAETVSLIAASGVGVGLAILLQSTWSCVLTLSGSYGQLLNYVVFADWIFFGLTVASLLVFRHTYTLDRRPPDTFRMPGYPVVPIAFCLVAAAVVLSVVGSDPRAAGRGALLLAAGVHQLHHMLVVGGNRARDDLGPIGQRGERRQGRTFANAREIS